MQFHSSGLTPKQLEVLKKTGECVSKLNYYLGGGTAISIYFGHRGSFDLDWFTSSSLPDPLQFAQLLRNERIDFVTETLERGTLYGNVENVRLSFLEYQYKLLQPLTFWQERSCYLASLDDLACMKLVAVAQRGSRKDFIDIYVLVKNYKPLPELLLLYQNKYQTENIAPVLLGMAYFDDAEDEPDPPLWSMKWQEIKREISKWVRQI